MIQRLIILVSAFSASLLLLLLYARLNVAEVPKASISSHINPDSEVVHESRLNASLAHAEKIWKRAAESRKLMAERMGYDREFPDGYISPFHVWDFARPSFYCPHDLERVGSLADGGKVICGMSRYEEESPGRSSNDNPARDLIVYSFGVSRDSTFELEMLARTNAEIWGYDYSVTDWGRGMPKGGHPRAHFETLGIGKVTDRDATPPMVTIYDLMKTNGHSFVDILKMDIEGAEFDVLTSLIESVLADGNASLPFGQLLVEVHFKKKQPEGFNIPRDLSSWLKWWDSLEKMGLRPVNNEENWIGDVVSGKPRFKEYTLINVFEKERNILLWE